MLLSKATKKLLEAFFDIEVEAFTNDKPSSLFDRQVALHKLKVQVLTYIKERESGIFIIKNTTADGNWDLCITIPNLDNPQTRVKIYEIRLAQNCETFSVHVKDM